MAGTRFGEAMRGRMVGDFQVTQDAPRESFAAPSFRDPAGRVFRYGDEILRLVNALGTADWEALSASPTGRELLTAGRIVPTRALNDDETAALLESEPIRAMYEGCRAELVLSHERIVFPSFPYEWPPEMLHAAGRLSLELAEALLADGLGLKDATPYNVLFRGTEPVFTDVLSVERRDASDPIWLPYAQFVRTFLLPLLANARFGMSLEAIFTTRRDGLEPEDVYRLTGMLQRLRPQFLGLVSMPAWLGRGKERESIYRKKTLSDPEKARFILRSTLRSLSRKLNRLTPAAGKSSVWSDYMSSNNNYTDEHFHAKQAFVQRAMEEFRPRQVLDVGCNTGLFSAVAARAGAGVVAVDYDPVVVGNVWRAARKEKLNILPLVVNLTRPSPATGWRNRECPSFLDRARGHFDGVLMLAVIHHMLVTERVPLEQIMDQAAELIAEAGILVIEYVGPKDSMFHRLARGRDELHRDLTIERFEQVCGVHFETVRSQHVEGTERALYLLRKRVA
jgi:SAM-dependent methyltransferase